MAWHHDPDGIGRPYVSASRHRKPGMFRKALLLLIASLPCTAAAEDEQMLRVQAFDHINDSDYVLTSTAELSAFRQSWLTKAEIVDQHPVDWNAGIRIDFASTSQVWLYDADTGTIEVLSKVLSPRYRIDDVAGFNRLLRISQRRDPESDPAQ